MKMSPSWTAHNGAGHRRAASWPPADVPLSSAQPRGQGCFPSLSSEAAVFLPSGNKKQPQNRLSSACLPLPSRLTSHFPIPGPAVISRRRRDPRGAEPSGQFSAGLSHLLWVRLFHWSEWGFTSGDEEAGVQFKTCLTAVLLFCFKGHLVQSSPSTPHLPDPKEPIRIAH